LALLVLHTGGNIHSNLDLWVHGHAEWQASSGPTALVWQAGADASFWASIAALLVVLVATLSGYWKLARATREPVAQRPVSCYPPRSR
jgi:hypothetical protein